MLEAAQANKEEYILESQKKNATILLSMTEEEKETLKHLAKRSGVSVSELVRLTLVHQSIELPKKVDAVSYKIKEPVLRNDSVYVQVSSEEKQAMKQRAESLGCSMSDLIRRSTLEGEIKSVEFDEALLKENYHELAKQGTNLNQLMYWLNSRGMSAYQQEEVDKTINAVQKAVVASIELFKDLKKGMRGI